jgi:flavorubredoxin
VKPVNREIVKGIHYVGVDDHHTSLFESLWALPHGVSYNSYLIVDDKIALIECVKEPWADEWIANIREVVDPAKIDYIIMNHMEPDHTGALPHIAKIAENVTMIYTPKASDMQRSFYDVRLREKTVNDLEELPLGKRTLKFVHAQFLHWPETMMTYDMKDHILFSCDAFGSFGALNGNHFDDEIDMRMIESESRRYLSAIITSYLKFVQQAIAKVKGLGIDLKMIAPSHGPVYRKDPMWIVSRYAEWSSPDLEKGCTIIYGTMYGFTHRVAMTLKKELENLAVPVRIHNISYSEMSRIITDTLRAGVIAIGTPTYDAYPFPRIWAFVNEMEGKRFARRPICLFGTFGWAGGGVRRLKEKFEDMKFEVLEPVIDVHGRPTSQELEDCKKLAWAIAAKVRH